MEKAGRTGLCHAGHVAGGKSRTGALRWAPCVVFAMLGMPGKSRKGWCHQQWAPRVVATFQPHQGESGCPASWSRLPESKLVPAPQHTFQRSPACPVLPSTLPIHCLSCPVPSRCGQCISEPTQATKHACMCTNAHSDTNILSKWEIPTLSTG